MLTEFQTFLATSEFDPADSWGNHWKAAHERHLYATWRLAYMRRCNERSMFCGFAACEDLDRAEALAGMAAEYWQYVYATQQQQQLTREGI